MELCLSDKRVSKMPVDLSELSAEGEPPPKAAFWLLDRPVPESGIELTVDAVPNVLGEMYVFGKRTDRDARLEFAILRDERFEATKTALTDVLGEFLNDSPTEEDNGQVPKLTATLTWRWRLPDDTPPSKRQELIKEQRREVYLHRWTELTFKNARWQNSSPSGSRTGRQDSDAGGDSVART